MRIVVDTNVLVSGLLSPHGAPGRVVDGLISEALQMLYDDRLLEEYREVLARPKFGFVQRDVDDLMTQLAAAGEHIAASPLDLELPHADDLPFLEVASAGNAEALVTGNPRHFPARARRGVQLMSPAEFVKHWAEVGQP